MLSSFQNHFEAQRGAATRPRIRVELARPAPPQPANGVSQSKHVYSKIFRWRMPDGQAEPPRTVEIAGSFTHWEKVPMTPERERGVWSATIDSIPLNRTHHYMLLVDGKPAPDENADGFAVPHGPKEEQYQLQTKRGGRVFIMYAQAK